MLAPVLVPQCGSSLEAPRLLVGIRRDVERGVSAHPRQYLSHTVMLTSEVNETNQTVGPGINLGNKGVGALGCRFN